MHFDADQILAVLLIVVVTLGYLYLAGTRPSL